MTTDTYEILAVKYAERLDRFRAAALASARRADVSAAAMSLETLVERIREGRRG